MKAPPPYLHPDAEHEILPHLANLVAYTIRDKVVLEQMEEIRQLRALLDATRRVEITGMNGSPIFAVGDFTKGEFNSEALHGEGVLWDVGLSMAHQNEVVDGNSARRDATTATSSGAVPLDQLSHIEIRIGGILYATSDEIDGTKVAVGIRPGNRFDLRNNNSTTEEGGLDMTRSVVSEFDTENKTALLTFHMRGFPKGHWRSLQSVAMVNRSIAIRNEEREENGDLQNEYDDTEQPLDVFKYITGHLAERHPDQCADITSVSFSVMSVRDTIANLRRGTEFEKLKIEHLT
jgi:hypothetical protein